MRGAPGNWRPYRDRLVQRGYADDDIQKIIGGNVMRVAREVLPEGLREQ